MIKLDRHRNLKGLHMISILLCTYNGEAYLPAQLDSILAQETTQDFRIIASDDGSTDHTPEILRDYAARYPGRILVRIQSPATGSAWKHFLRLLADRAYGDADYVMLSDQDDVWYPQKIEESFRAMQALEKETGGETGSSLNDTAEIFGASLVDAIPLLVHCDSEVVGPALEPIAPSYVAYQKMTPARKAFRQLLVQNNVVGGSILMNRALAEKIRAVPAHCVMHDQWLALIAAAFGEIRFLPRALYAYRQHGDNVLGAERGSRLGEVLGRFGIGRKDGRSKAEMDAHSRRVYEEMFRQADAFLGMYGSELPESRRKELRAFLRIPREARPVKIITILRYGFTYNLLHRTVGECLFIP